TPALTRARRRRSAGRSQARPVATFVVSCGTTAARSPRCGAGSLATSRARSVAESGGLLAAPGLLQDPGVAVGVAEVGERVVVAVLGIGALLPALGGHGPHLAPPDAAPDQVGARRLDVRDDEVRAAVRPRLGVRDPDSDR